MPKYHYSCKSCTRDWWEWRGMTEPDLEVCPSCDQKTVVKVPTQFAIPAKQASGGKRKVGEETKEYIEENREVLKQMKEEAKSVEFK